MMKSTIRLAMILLALLSIGAVLAQDSEAAKAAYFQSRAFNAPILEGWLDQSGDDYAQFQLAEAQATIRTAIVARDDVIDAVGAELSDAFEIEVGEPAYQDKVNLADGTWTVLVYDYDEVTTASVMARLADTGAVVISFVEQDPAARTALLTMARTDDSPEDAGREIAMAIAAVAEKAPSDLAQAERAMMPSGEWVIFAGEGLTAMGMVFGNDSYVALRQGKPGDLAALADAYNRTLLGFFMTPDNSQYLALGLAVVFVILGLLVGSLFWRERGIRKDLALLEALAEEDG